MRPGGQACAPAVVAGDREALGAATGITPSGIYVGAAAGPAAFGVLSTQLGYQASWAGVSALALLAALAIGLAARWPSQPTRCPSQPTRCPS